MKKSNPKVVAIDFDETLGLYTPADNGKGYIVKQVTSAVNPRLVSFIKLLRSKGVRVIVYSSRWWGDYNALAAWLRKNKIKVDDIVLGRMKADAYICDKSVYTFEDDMEQRVLDMLDSNNSWGCHFNRFYKQVGENRLKKVTPTFQMRS